MTNSGIKNITIVVEPNTEDPEIGGFFASFIDGWGRGHGFTELEAVFNLVLLKGEQEGENWDTQAGDLVITATIHNSAIEEALARHYGGSLAYLDSYELEALAQSREESS